ncbi:MAG: MotA/TolQ/ExbB proton channel family protein [Bacteroidota bacterium]
MRNQISSPNKFFDKLLLSAYATSNNGASSKISRVNQRIGGRSPLDIPNKTVFMVLFASVLISILIGNIFIISLHMSIGLVDLPRIEEEEKSFSGELNSPNILVDRLLPHLISKLSDADSLRVKQVITENFPYGRISVQGITNYINLAKQQDQVMTEHGMVRFQPLSADFLEELIIGKLERSPWSLWLIPTFQPISPSEIADQLGIEKNYQEEVGQTSEETWERFIFISAIQYLRDRMNVGITHPRRLLQAIGGGIQWITFIAAVWCLLMLLVLRTPWAKLQAYLIVNNQLPWHRAELDVWDTRAPYSGELDRKEHFPGMFLVPRLMKDINNSLEDQTTTIYHAIRERVEAYRNSIEIGEYEIINFLIWAIPTFGFIGTIFGIITAMENAAAIFSAATPLEQSIALDAVSVALGTAFDTSFIALIWLVPMSYFLARTRKAEANLFEELEYEAIRHLPPQLKAKQGSNV